MKYLIGVLFAGVAMVLLTLAQKYISSFFSDFLNGWLCCVAYHLGMDIYETKFSSK